MIEPLNRYRLLILTTIFVAGLAGLAAALAGHVDIAVQSASTDWPPLTMTYEVPGAPAMVGDEALSGTEIRRIDYASKTSWTDTVIEAPSIETTVGTFSPVGSFRRLDGGVITEYDSISNTTSTMTELDGVSHVAGSAFVRYSIDELQRRGFKFQRVTTGSKVCFESSCEENAGGISLSHNGQKYVFVDDVRGIPLKIGSSFFRVREVQIDDGKQPVNLEH